MLFHIFVSPYVGAIVLIAHNKSSRNVSSARSCIAPKSYRQFRVRLRKFLTQQKRSHTNEIINYEKEINVSGSSQRAGDGGMPDTAADGAEPAGNGSSNSTESGAIRYELSLGNRNSSF